MKELIGTNFSVTWDPEKLSDTFPIISNKDLSPYSHPTGVTHWQLYKTGILFGRNFYANNKTECEEVAEKLEIIQKRLKGELLDTKNYLLKIFLDHDINPKHVNLLKTIPGKDVQLHRDVTRNFCINIGLKNSSKWTTIISKDINIENFEKSQKESFVINDGDVYIVWINFPHKALCIDPDDLISTRFLITYTIPNSNILTDLYE